MGFVPSVLSLPDKFEITLKFIALTKATTETKMNVDETVDKDKTKIWIHFQNESLKVHDKEIICRGDWLTDKHISFSQQLIKNYKWPTIHTLSKKNNCHKMINYPHWQQPLGFSFNSSVHKKHCEAV